MIKHEKAIETLRLRGHRLTPQRLIVLSTIASRDGHMGVDEVFQAAKKAYPYMDIATVYRTLHLFKNLGVVTNLPTQKATTITWCAAPVRVRSTLVPITWPNSGRLLIKNLVLNLT